MDHRIASTLLALAYVRLAAQAAQGLLPDLDAATLAVWLNGEEKGVAVGPGMANMGRLDRPLRWAVGRLA